MNNTVSSPRFVEISIAFKWFLFLSSWFRISVLIFYLIFLPQCERWLRRREGEEEAERCPGPDQRDPERPRGRLHGGGVRGRHGAARWQGRHMREGHD